MPKRQWFLLGGLALALCASPAATGEFEAWILRRGQIQTQGQPGDGPLPVGSLQKPFVVRAWARTHRTETTPRFTCTSTSGCWRPSGHGTLDLRGAIRESCNTFFKLLARETPQAALQDSFREAGFNWSGEVSESEAIGLPGAAHMAVAPSRLLRSYVDLVRSPWPEREDVRRELLAGLKDSAEDGTASGLRLRGFRAKTGTVPALDGAPFKTSGFALVLDDAGFAYLGLLRRGTGREAAIRAGAAIAKMRPGSLTRPSPPGGAAAASRPRVRPPARDLLGSVRVEMLDELGLTEVTVRNVGQGPVDSSRGYLGPGATIRATDGDRFSEGDWEIGARKPVFARRVHASLEVARRDGPVRIVATMSARAYANGILKAELGPGPPSLRAQLAAAVLRFVGRGPRHARADVCDSTHCAWFVGQGPVPRWLRPDSARAETETLADLDDREWETASNRARSDPEGPDQWTADCGGDPVSPHFVWGGGDRTVVACPRHPRGRGREWKREWKAADLAAVFGATVESADVTDQDGQWMLKVSLAPRTPAGPRTVLMLPYDEVHRRLAGRLGWDAMPAPAARVVRSSEGYVASGVGFGHRVGLCLAP